MESYLPVPYDFREVLSEQVSRGTTGKVFFWSASDQVDEQMGTIIAVEENGGEGIFAAFQDGARVRIDRIITLFGKPGPGFETYDAFANQCLACTAGVPL